MNENTQNNANRPDVIKALNNIEQLAKISKSNQSKNLKVKLENLLEHIEPIDYHDYLELAKEESLKQKHIIFGTIKYILEVSKSKKWELCQQNGIIYFFNSEYWQPIEKDELKSFLGESAMKMGCKDYEASHYDFKERLFKQFISYSHLPALENCNENAYINLKNGTFEFKAQGGLLRPFNPKDFITYQLPFEFKEDATCPMFINYLTRVLPDKDSQDLLQEFSGYIFSNKRLEKMLLLTGSGHNGKSVYHDIIIGLLGAQNVLNYALGEFKQPFNRAELVNKLLNFSSELGQDLHPDILKQLISNEPMQACKKFGHPFTLKNKAKFIVNSNNLPKEVENSVAFFRRWIIIPFQVQITEAEKDCDLSKKIIRNEMPGVFNWLLEGLKRLHLNGKFTESETSKQSIEAFKKQSDTVQLFIEDYEYTKSQTKKPLSEIYSDYKLFCQDEGIKKLGKNIFSKELEMKEFEKTRGNDGSSVFLMKKK